MQLNVLIALTESKIINRNEVGTSEIMYDAVWGADASVADAG